MPTPAGPLDETLPVTADYGDFSEIPEIINEVKASGAVLVEGAPGSGKSHLVRDLQTSCVINNLPAFCLTMHVNAGKADGVERITPFLEEFRDRVRETGGGLVILDNVDYVGYKGKSRSKIKSIQYAQSSLEMVQSLIEDANTAVIATAHDDEWRQGKWSWNNEQIDKPAQAIMDLFPSRFVFEGKMALMGLAHILSTRTQETCMKNPESEEVPLSIGEAAQVMRMLDQSGRANFFHARHLPVHLFLDNPEAAIAKIEQGRAERRGQA